MNPTTLPPGTLETTAKQVKLNTSGIDGDATVVNKPSLSHLLTYKSEIPLK